MTNSVTGHDVLYPGRAQYVTLQLSPELQIGVINIYGFSHTCPRAMLWNHLPQVQLPDAHWILPGDFNNIEQASHKQGGSSKTNIRKRKLEAWKSLLVGFGGRDAHHVGTFGRRSNKPSRGLTPTTMPLWSRQGSTGFTYLSE